jgi:hypothetical protein
MVAVKHHQWVVLNRDHAEQSLEIWSHEQNRHFKVTGDTCQDEIWYMMALYGPQPKPTLFDGGNRYRLEDFTSDGLEWSDGVQGQCDTFAIWFHDIVVAVRFEGDHEPALDLYIALDQDSRPIVGGPHRPGEFRQLSLDSVHEIRDSELLFIRKITKDAKIVGANIGFSDGWIQTVFS